LEREENRFALVLMAAQRARQLMKTASPLVNCRNKPLVTALREIAAGKVKFDRNTAQVVDHWVAQQRRFYNRQPGHVI